MEKIKVQTEAGEIIELLNRPTQTGKRTRSGRSWVDNFSDPDGQPVRKVARGVFENPLTGETYRTYSSSTDDLSL